VPQALSLFVLVCCRTQKQKSVDIFLSIII
jgi:hypothetical protein